MGAGDAVDHVGVLASYAVLDRPSLHSQGARVGVGVGVEYIQQRHLVFPHFLKPGSVPRLAPRLLSTDSGPLIGLSSSGLTTFFITSSLDLKSTDWN